MTKKERFENVLKYFSTERPVAETELEYTNPYELLVAVILFLLLAPAARGAFASFGRPGASPRPSSFWMQRIK